MLKLFLKRRFSGLVLSNLLRKKGILFENVKREHCKVQMIVDYFRWKGVHIREQDVHIMTNLLARPTGRVMVLIEHLKKQNFSFDFGENSKEQTKEIENTNNTNSNNSNSNKNINEVSVEVKNLFKNCKVHLCDDYEIEKFVEECERFIRFTEDIKRISCFDNLDKVITIINVPTCYGRKELQNIIFECSGVKVQMKNIIFRFKKNGTQSDCAYVLCDHVKDANLIITKMQEYPVAKKYHLKEFFGASFLYASRNNLFISSENIDYLTNFSKYKICSFGWHKDISIKEFEDFLITLKIFPCKIIKIGSNEKNHSETDANENHVYVNIERKNEEITEQTNTACFIIFFENMRMTKKVFTKLERLKKKWKIASHHNFYAYPKIPDLHFNDDEEYSDENEYEDSDIDEEIEY